jgi:hypothetical protein
MGLNNALRRAEEWDGCPLTLPVSLIVDRMNEDEKKESGKERK